MKRKPVDVSALRFRDLHLLRRQFSSVPGVRALDDRFEPTPIMSEEPVFRTHAAASTDYLPYTPDTPKRTGAAPRQLASLLLHGESSRKNWAVLDASSTPENAACIPDLNGDGRVDGSDIGLLFAAWGVCPDADCPADFTGDGLVDSEDLGVLLAAWSV